MEGKRSKTLTAGHGQPHNVVAQQFRAVAGGDGKPQMVKNGSEMSLTPSQAAEQTKLNARKHPLDALSKTNASLRQKTWERRSGLQDVDEEYIKQNIMRKPFSSRYSGLNDPYGMQQQQNQRAAGQPSIASTDPYQAAAMQQNQAQMPYGQTPNQQHLMQQQQYQQQYQLQQQQQQQQQQQLYQQMTAAQQQQAAMTQQNMQQQVPQAMHAGQQSQMMGQPVAAGMAGQQHQAHMQMQQQQQPPAHQQQQQQQQAQHQQPPHMLPPAGYHQPPPAVGAPGGQPQMPAQHSQTPHNAAMSNGPQAGGAGSGAMPEPDMCTTCPNCQTTIYLVRGGDAAGNEAAMPSTPAVSQQQQVQQQQQMAHHDMPPAAGMMPPTGQPIVAGH